MTMDRHQHDLPESVPLGNIKTIDETEQSNWSINRTNLADAFLSSAGNQRAEPPA